MWPRFHGLLTVCKRGVRHGQIKVRKALPAAIPPADAGHRCRTWIIGRYDDTKASLQNAMGTCMKPRGR